MFSAMMRTTQCIIHKFHASPRRRHAVARTRPLAAALVMVFAATAFMLTPAAPTFGQSSENGGGEGQSNDAPADEPAGEATVAEQSGGLSPWIRRNQVHRIAGYTSLGLMAGTATAGMLAGADVEAARTVHPYLGLATTVSAATSSALGSIAYNDRLRIVWPHAVLNGLAVTGLMLNSFGVFEYGSLEHRVTGILSTASMAGAYLSIVWILR
jgi:hypothetical protein